MLYDSDCTGADRAVRATSKGAMALLLGLGALVGRQFRDELALINKLPTSFSSIGNLLFSSLTKVALLFSLAERAFYYTKKPLV